MNKTMLTMSWKQNWNQTGLHVHFWLFVNPSTHPGLLPTYFRITSHEFARCRNKISSAARSARGPAPAYDVMHVTNCDRLKVEKLGETMETQMQAKCSSLVVKTTKIGSIPFCFKLEFSQFEKFNLKFNLKNVTVFFCLWKVHAAAKCLLECQRQTEKKK